ncbi:hypothetical protein KAU51_03985 [Candidatus Parcubacteria bacterium]|nr:hypothetical protein [Candidatus Parcubacteria bacterium]
MEKALKAKVEYILQEFPDTRNSDIELMITIIERYYSNWIEGDEYIKLSDLHQLPREDHIKRIRAKFNSVGKYLPTEWEVAKARRINEEVWREAMKGKLF